MESSYIYFNLWNLVEISELVKCIGIQRNHIETTGMLRNKLKCNGIVSNTLKYSEINWNPSPSLGNEWTLLRFSGIVSNTLESTEIL